MLAVTTKTAEYADEIDKLSERTGINREELQRWKYAAGQSGADIGKLEVGVKTLSGYMDDAMNGSKKATSAFEALGISVDDLRNTSQEDMFEKVMASLGDMEQGAQRNAIGADLLGRSYTELMPLLNAGSGGMRELKDRADELGIVMSEDAVKANVVFGDTMDDLKSSFGGIARDLTNGLLPVLQGFIDFILANMPMIQETIGSVFGAISTSVMGVLPFLMDLITNALPPMIALFTDIASNILPPVIALFTQILQAVLPPLIELFSGVIQTILPPLTALLKIIIEDILPPFIQLFTDVISVILPPLMDLFGQIIDTLLPPLIDLFQQIIDAVMPILIELFTTFVEIVLPPLMELINEIVQVILPPLLVIFNELAKLVLPLVMAVFEAMMPVIEPIMKAISAVIKTVLALIKGDWEGVWNGIKEFFSAYLDYIVKLVEGFQKIFGGVWEAVGKGIRSVWDGIVGNIKGAVNTVTSIVNGMVSTVTGAVNSAIKLINKIPGVNIKTLSAPQIPALAEGGDIARSGRVLVGDAGPEFLDLPQGARVTPLGKAGGISFDRGAFEGVVIMDDYGVDRLMDRIKFRLGELGV